MSNDTIDFHETYTSEDMDRAGKRLHVNTILVLIINIFCGYVIMKYSTKAMGKYRFFLLLTIIASTIMDFHLSFIFGPLPTFPIPGFCSAGFIARHLDYFWGEIIQYILLHVTFSFVGNTLLMASAYRYAVMIDKEELFLSWYGITAMILSCLFYPTIPILFLILSLDDRKTTLEYVKQEAPYMYDLYVTEPCNSIKTSPMTVCYVIAAATHIFFAFFLGIHISKKMNIVLLSKKNMISSKTFKLYKQMFLSFVVQATVPFICLVIPIMALLIVVMIKLPNIKVFAEYLMQSISFHSISNSISVIAIIKPYRVGAYKLIMKLLPCITFYNKTGFFATSSQVRTSTVIHIA